MMSLPITESNNNSDILNVSTNMTTPENTTAKYEYPSAWSSHFSLSLFMVIGYLLCMIPGIMGNLLVIFSILTNKGLRSVANMFIVNLAFADFCIVSMIEPFSLLPILIDAKIYDKNPTFCAIFGLICLYACCASPASLAFIGFNRYVCVCHNRLYTYIFSRKGNIIVFSLLWAYCLSTVIVVPIGWGKLVFDPNAMLCTADRNTAPDYATMVAFIDMWIPIIFVAIFYVMIFCSVHHSKTKLRKFSNDSSDTLMSKAHLDQELKLAKTLLAVFLTFLLCIAPWAVLMVLDSTSEMLTKEKINRRAAFHISALLYHLNSSINPILYGVTNPRFRKGYWQFLRKIGLCVPEAWLSNTGVQKSNSISTAKPTKSSTLSVSETIP